MAPPPHRARPRRPGSPAWLQGSRVLPSIDSTHFGVLTAMITPAFFLTATGQMLLNGNQRLARVVDRMRDDLARLETHPDGAERDRLVQRVRGHRRRAALVLTSLRMLYAAMAAFVATSLAIAISSYAAHRVDVLPVTLAIVGVLLLFAAAVCLGREARLGLKMLNDELVVQLARR
jgi:hypothetical protein